MSATVHDHIATGPAAAGEAAEAGEAGGLARLATAVLQRIDDLTDELVTELRSQDPAYAGEVVPRDDLWRSCHDNLVRVVEHLVAEPSDPEVAFEPPRATGRRRAEQGFPLENLLHAYRVGGRIIWESLLAEARRAEHGATEQLAESASQVWDVIDAYSAVVGSAYRTREAELERFDQERRLTLLDGLLDGKGRDPRFRRDALAVLGLPSEGPFVVAVVRHATAEATVAPPASTELLAAWRHRSHQHVGIVPLDRQPLDAVREVLAGRDDTAVGLSPPADLADLAQAQRWAELAAATASPGEVASLDDHLPAALLAAEPELGARLVDRVFAPLAELDADERDRLLETLDAYLDNSFSVAAAATQLYCHRNTVTNRLRRLEEVTGRRLEDHGDLLELTLGRLASRAGLEPR